MKYITSAYSIVVEAYNRLKQRLGAGTFFSNGGLEFAVAGMPDNIASSYDVRSVIDNYVFQSNVNGWYTEGNKVMVRADGGRKTVPLDPKSVKHDASGYVAKKLRDNGVHTNSSTVNKIAKELQNLRDRLKGN